MDIYKTIRLDKQSKTPLYQQLADSLLLLIEQGELEAGTKLPPIRRLALMLDVNNVTVINAYKYLESKKAVYSHVGSGTFVADPDLNRNKPITKTLLTKKNLGEINYGNYINFADTSVSADLFPVDRFKQCFDAVLERDKGAAFSYQSSMGYEPLREAMAVTLEESGIKTSSERIQIISGAQQGLDIISKAMLKTNDIVFTEKPTYYGALGAIFSRGAQAVEIPLDEDGINLYVLQRLLKIYTPKFIYVMPCYQTPTGICYSLKKKRELLELAYRHNFYIVEEDNMGDFSYTEEKPVPLKALDYRNKVIYIKSFSKILMPGLRIGCTVLPKAVLQAVDSAKYSSDISTSGFIQRAFELYLKSGDHHIHTERMRSVFGKKYKLITDLADKKLSKYFDFQKSRGGLTLWLRSKNSAVSSDALYTALIGGGVLITPGSLFTSEDEDIMRHIRISFANVTDADIAKGIDIIADVCSTMNTG